MKNYNSDNSYINNNNNIDSESIHTNRKDAKLYLPSILVCLLIICIFTAMALRIHNQNLLIMTQSEELRNTQDIQGTQDTPLTRDGVLLGAEKSLSMLAEGDRLGALKAAYSVFPGAGKEDIPYTPQAAYALSESLHIYTGGTEYFPDIQLKMDSAIKFMLSSMDSSRILAVDESGMLSVWLSENGMLLDSFPVVQGGLTDPDKSQFAFIDATRFVYPTAYGFALYDTEKHDIVYSFADQDNMDFLLMEGIPRGAARVIPNGWGMGDGFEQVAVEEGGRRYLVRMRSGYLMVKADTGEILCSVPITQEDYYQYGNGDDIVFCGKDRFAVATDQRHKELRLYDASDGSLVCIFPLNGGSIMDMSYFGDMLYLVEKGTENAVDTVYGIHVTREEVLWTRQENEYGLWGIVPANAADSRYVVCVGRDICVTYNRWTGFVGDRFQLDSEIVRYGCFKDSDIFLLFTKDGNRYHLHTDDIAAEMYSIYFEAVSANIKWFDLGWDYAVTLPEESRTITLYRTPVGSKAEVFRESSVKYDKGIIDSNGQRFVVAGTVPDSEGTGPDSTRTASAVENGDEDTVYLEMLDTASGNVLWHSKVGGELLDMKFYEEQDALVLAMDDGIYLLDRYSGKRLAHYIYLSGEDLQYDGIVEPEDYIGMDDTGRYVFVRHFDTVVGYDLADGSVKYMIKDILLAGTDVCLAVDPSMSYFVYSSKAADSLEFYRLSDCEFSGGPELKYGGEERYRDFAYTGIQASYVKSLIFDDGGLTTGVPELYVEYQNGDIRVYSLQAGIDRWERNEKSLFSTILNIEEEPIRTYQEMDAGLVGYIHPEGYEYAVAEGDRGAYMLIDKAEADGMEKEDVGQLAAYISGFLALDPVNDRIYVRGSGGSCIYQIPIYDAGMLSEEAHGLLYGNEE